MFGNFRVFGLRSLGAKDGTGRIIGLRSIWAGHLVRMGE